MRRTLAGSAAALLLAASLSGCGGDGPGGTRPSLSPTGTPTRELPTPTRSATDEPTEPTSAEPSDGTTEPEPTSAQPSDDTTEPEPTSAEPTDDTTEPEPTRTPTRQPESTEASPSPSDDSEEETSEPPSESAEASPEDDAAADEATDDDLSWLWWLLAALVLGALVAIPLIVRSRRRAAWRGRLSEAEAELGWLARELLPELRRMGSLEQVAGAWAVAAPRVTAAEDALTALEPTAPDDAGQERARALRDASRLARQRMEQLVAPGPHDTWAPDLDAIMADLEAALGPPPAPPA